MGTATLAVFVAGLLPGLLSLSAARAPRAEAAPSTCGADGCAITIDARDFASGDPLASFTYIINADNTRYINPATRQPVDPFPKYVTTESNSPIVREGDQDRRTVNLPDGRYLISVRSLDHKLWGKHITLPRDAADNGSLNVRIDLTEQSDDHLRGHATATRTAAGTRRPRSTVASASRPVLRRAATAPARPASSCGSRRPTAPPTGSGSSARPRRSRIPGPARSPARPATGRAGRRLTCSPSARRCRTRSSR